MNEQGHRLGELHLQGLFPVLYCDAPFVWSPCLPPHLLHRKGQPQSWTVWTSSRDTLPRLPTCGGYIWVGKGLPPETRRAITTDMRQAKRYTSKQSICARTVRKSRCQPNAWLNILSKACGQWETAHINEKLREIGPLFTSFRVSFVIRTTVLRIRVEIVTYCTLEVCPRDSFHATLFLRCRDKINK